MHYLSSTYSSSSEECTEGKATKRKKSNKCTRAISIMHHDHDASTTSSSVSVLGKIERTFEFILKFDTIVGFESSHSSVMKVNYVVMEHQEQ